MQWISVDEQLPEEDMPVLVFAALAPGIKKTITLAYWSVEDNDWDIEYDDRLIGINTETIRYWMPIPAPPE